MSNIQPRRVNPIARTIRKFFVSGFVVATFVAYALHERFGGAPASANATPLPLAAQPPAPSQRPPATAQPPKSPQAAVPTAPPPPTARTLPTVAPTEAPTDAPVAQNNGLYRDGSYAGPVADAYYGNMQVQAVIQAGKLTDVQILEYPNDRRTSIRINNIALPYLISEAIQAQSANVDAISGATLSSDAFVQSLQSALNSAKNKGAA